MRSMLLTGVLVLAGALGAMTPSLATDGATPAQAETAVPPPTPPTSPVASGSAAPEEGPSALRGRLYLEQTCSGCHAIAAVDVSREKRAPAFRDILKLYPAEALEESLAEGIVTGHPDMPEVVLDPPQIGNVIAYLEALAVVTGR